VDNTSDECKLLAVTFVKCKVGTGRSFGSRFARRWLNKDWSPQARGTSSALLRREQVFVRPITLGMAAGYFDFIIIMETTSAYSVSEFCMEVLRGSTRSGGLGKHVLDTQTAIAVKFSK